jgi:hypothetical protein
MNREWGSRDSPGTSAFIFEATGRIGPNSDGIVLGAGALAGRPPRPLLLANAQRVEVNRNRRADRREPREAVELYPLTGSLREQLGVYDAPDATTVMLIEPPEPMGLLDQLVSPPGKQIRCAMRGTLGPSVATLAGRRYLTAGHVAGLPGTSVERIIKPRLGHTKYRRIGEVENSTQPLGHGGPWYDVAALELDGGSGRPCRVAHLSQFQTSSVAATLHGGVSGRGYGLVIASLAAHGDDDGRFVWTNSWIMTPGEIGAEGDSGGQVTVADEEVLGILVGGSRVKGSKNFAHLFVQDLESIERDLLSSGWNGA